MINLAKQYPSVENNHDLRGFLSRIGHNSSVDYLEMSYLQALSIKTTQSSVNSYAVLVDKETMDRIQPKHKELFDQIVVIDEPWGFDKEWQVRNYTPWKKTIKLDCDLILTEDISHWWESLEKHSLMFPTTIENYKHKKISSRWHRKLFDVNCLPDIYTAFYFFKDDLDSAEFFTLVKEISDNWPWFAKEFLIKNTDPAPRDDEIFSIAVEIFGEHRCTLPNADFPRFVHMKEPLNELPNDIPWHKQIHFENNNNKIWVGHYQQRLPFHYTSKTFVNKELIETYERNYRKLMESSS